ncbi:hypothetical protein Tco_0528389 [Tanacetum coccineum]
MSNMTTCLNDLSYIPLNNEQNEPTQGDIGKLTDSIFNEMLEFFQNVFPTAKGYKLPPSYYAIKKTFKMIGLGYESIHACVNDCFLFRGEDHKDKQFCPVCNTSRWKESNTPGKKVPKKCTKHESSFMLTLILGPKSPGKDIDVYLRPLIDDLKDLWAKPDALEDDPICPRWMYPFERFMKKLKILYRIKLSRKVFRSVCKSIGLRSIIRIDHQELKKVIWYVLHNSLEIDTYRVKFKRQDLGVSANHTSYSLGLVDYTDSISVTLVMLLRCEFGRDCHDECRNKSNQRHLFVWTVDMINDEDVLPHDLADSDDEDLVNVDDDDDVEGVHGVTVAVLIIPSTLVSRRLRGPPENPIWEAGKTAGCIHARNQEPWDKDIKQTEFGPPTDDRKGVPDALWFLAQHPGRVEGGDPRKD